jgi:hypothetical protein
MVEQSESRNGSRSTSRDGEGEAETVPSCHPPIKTSNSDHPEKRYFAKPENRVAFGTLVAVAIYTGITALMWLEVVPVV